MAHTSILHIKIAEAEEGIEQITTPEKDINYVTGMYF